MIACSLCCVLRDWSVSSMRSTNAPLFFRAQSQLNNAVRAPPMCRYPVGEGAKRTRTSDIGVIQRRSNGVMHLFSDSASHYSSTPLLQKNSACATAGMSISGEIHFGRGSVPINERPNAFDYVEADFRDVLRAQPFEDCAALERDWQCPQFLHREIQTNS